MIKNFKEILEIKGVSFSAQLKLKDQFISDSDIPSKKSIYKNAIEFFFKQAVPLTRREARLIDLAGFMASIRYYGQDQNTQFYLYSRLTGSALYLVDEKNKQIIEFVNFGNLNPLKKPLWPERGRLLKVLGPALQPRYNSFLVTPIIMEVTDKFLRFPLLPGLASFNPSFIEIVEDK